MKKWILVLMIILPVWCHSAEPDKEAQPTISPEVKSTIEKGVAAFHANRLEEAKKAFKKLLDLNPNDMTGLVNLGAIEYRLKNLEEAEKYLKKAVEIDRNTEAAWLTLGVIYNDQDRLDEALAALSQAIVLNKKEPRAHNFLGVVISKKGWHMGAESEFRRAIELDPLYAEANFNLALLYLQRTPPAIELARRHYYKALDLGASPDPLVEKNLK